MSAQGIHTTQPCLSVAEELLCLHPCAGGRLDALNSFISSDILSSEKIVSSVSPEGTSPIYIVCMCAYVCICVHMCILHNHMVYLHTALSTMVCARCVVLSRPVLTGYCQLCVGVLSEEIPGNKEAWIYNGACLLVSREWPVRRRCRELLKGIFLNNKETLFLFIDRMKHILDQQTLEVGVVLTHPFSLYQCLC